MLRPFFMCMLWVANAETARCGQQMTRLSGDHNVQPIAMIRETTEANCSAIHQGDINEQTTCSLCMLTSEDLGGQQLTC